LGALDLLRGRPLAQLAAGPILPRSGWTAHWPAKLSLPWRAGPEEKYDESNNSVVDSGYNAAFFFVVASRSAILYRMSCETGDSFMLSQILNNHCFSLKKCHFSRDSPVRNIC
jgi:hypothetical protein